MNTLPHYKFLDVRIYLSQAMCHLHTSHALSKQTSSIHSRGVASTSRMVRQRDVAKVVCHVTSFLTLGIRQSVVQYNELARVLVRAHADVAECGKAWLRG